MAGEQGGANLIASRSFPFSEDMYKIVDFLNKTLKDKRLMFGLTYDAEKGTAMIKVYEV